MESTLEHVGCIFAGLQTKKHWYLHGMCHVFFVSNESSEQNAAIYTGFSAPLKEYRYLQCFVSISLPKEPAFANKCLDNFPLSGGKFATVGELVRFRQIFPGRVSAGFGISRLEPAFVLGHSLT